MSDNRQVVYYDIRKETFQVDESTVVACIGIYRGRLYAVSGDYVFVVDVASKKPVTKWRKDRKNKEFEGRDMVLTCIKATEEGVYTGKVSMNSIGGERDRQIAVIELHNSWSGKRYSTL